MPLLQAVSTDTAGAAVPDMNIPPLLSLHAASFLHYPLLNFSSTPLHTQTYSLTPMTGCHKKPTTKIQTSY